MGTLTGSLDTLLRENTGEEISFGDVVKSFEHRGFGALLMIPAVIALLPTGAIPLVPDVCGLFIVLLSTQLLLGREHPWLPSWLQKFSIKREKMENAVEKARPWLEKVDGLLKNRLEVFTGTLATRVIAAVSILLALTMFPLGFIPMATALPSAAILSFALGLTAHDGLLNLVALVVAAGSFFLVLEVWPF